MLVKYCANIVQILVQCWPNIEQILGKYWANIWHKLDNSLWLKFEKKFVTESLSENMTSRKAIASKNRNQ